MLGERLHRARRAAGYSLRDLAQRTGLSHTTISKLEKDERKPSSGQLIKLSTVLGVRTEYFFRPQKVQLQGVEYRKHSAAPRKVVRQVHADVLDQAERWQELLGLYPQVPVPRFCLPQRLRDEFTEPRHIEEAADTLRREWGLGLNPIPDLIDTFESQGIMVIITDVADDGKIDGMAGRVDGAPFVVVSSWRPGDRQRLTLAHELGHLVLHGRITSGFLASVAPGRKIDVAEEHACHRFAGAFLFPEQAVLDRLGRRRTNLEAQELYLLKHEFGVSMQACLFRALHSGVISQGLHQKLFKAFSMRGWRSQEPGEPYPAEHTVLFEQLAYRAFAEEYIGESKAAELLNLPLPTFHRQRMLEWPCATAH